MKPFRDISIRRKLTMAILAASIVPLVLAAVLIFGYEMANLRTRVVRDLQARAELLAVSMRSMLEFDDADRAEETLATLQARPEMVAAALYEPDGKVFASYRRADMDAFAFPALPAGNFGTPRFLGDHVEFFHPIRSEGETVGHIYLRSDRAEYYARLKMEGWIVLGVLAGLVVLALWLSSEFQRIISRPILALTGTAQAVEEGKDYSVRAAKHGDDEIGTLADGFNQMLAGIQERDRTLQTASETLRASEARVRLATEATEVGIWEWNLLTNGIRWDAQMFRIYGVAPTVDGFVPYNIWSQAVLPEDLAGQEAILQDTVRRVGRSIRAFRIQRADNREHRHIEAVETVRTDAHGQAEWVVGTNLDITERKRAEDSLRVSKERLRTVMDLVPHFIFAKDADGRFLFVNRALAQAVGLTHEEMIGRTDAELLPDATQAAHFRQDDMEVIENGRAKFIAEERRTDRAGNTQILQTHKVPLPIPGSEKPAVLGVSVDITERIHAEEEVHRLNAELEQRVRERTAQLESTNKELEAFSYSVSHDLRAPLRAVNGYVRMLEKKHSDQLDAEGLRLLGVVTSEAQRMGCLIDDLLAFSRMGRQRVESADIDMTAMVRAEFERLTKDAPAPAPRLDLKPLPPAQGDSAMLRQVFANLLGNAVKFSRKQAAPAIEVGATGDNGTTTYYVKDNGVGFDEKYRDKLFGVFQRLHNDTEYEGTGIGLALVQRIVHRHGGTVRAEGKVGEGAAFYFTIPTRRGSNL